MTRILVTGSRDWSAPAPVLAAIERVEARSSGPLVLVHGAARGLDSMAAELIRGRPRWTEEAHPADWATHGRAAGHRRNAAMVDLGAALCLAFPLPGSRGTWDCVRRAVEAGVPAMVWESECWTRAVRPAV
jgi:hypothetical protein